MQVKLEVDGHEVVMVVENQQVTQRIDVRYYPLHNGLLLGRISHAHLDSAIQAKFAVADLLQQFAGSVQHEVRRQQPMAILAAGTGDQLCRLQLFLPSQQWDLPHLHQIHADRIIGAFDCILELFQVPFFDQLTVEFIFFFLLVVVQHFIQFTGRAGVVVEARRTTDA